MTEENEITIEEFLGVHLRAAKVISAERIKDSRKLLKLVIDLGTEERTVVAGIAENYTPDEVQGKTIIVCTNLKPAKLMGVESRGMVLTGVVNDQGILAIFDREVPPGVVVR